MIVLNGQPVDPADVAKLRAYLVKAKSVAASQLSNLSQAQKILDKISPPPSSGS